MGRNITGELKAERIQIRLSEADRERLEAAWMRLRPRIQFQEFLLELMDHGMELLAYRDSLLEGSAASFIKSQANFEKLA